MPSLVTCDDTIKLTATFKDWDGIPGDPDPVTFTVYDENMVQKSTEVLDPTHRLSAGVWQAFFTPADPGVYLCEFGGVLTGNAIARRLRVEARQVV
ncbi:MAG: hypothetical protein ACM3UP_00630 [Methanocella sp.]